MPLMLSCCLLLKALMANNLVVYSFSVRICEFVWGSVVCSPLCIFLIECAGNWLSRTWTWTWLASGWGWLGAWVAEWVLPRCHMCVHMCVGFVWLPLPLPFSNLLASECECAMNNSTWLGSFAPFPRPPLQTNGHLLFLLSFHFSHFPSFPFLAYFWLECANNMST